MNRNDLRLQNLENLKGNITQVKNTIKDLNARRRALSSQPVFNEGQGLAHAMGQFLPKGIVPGNVGNLNTVSWQFNYTTDFDLSQNNIWQQSIIDNGVPGISNLTEQTQSFQVTQEAAFLMMGIMRHANDYEAGDLAPLTFQFRDAQSSRFFNNEPTPIQAFGQKGYMQYMAVPMILMPNARFEIKMGCSLDPGVLQLFPVDTSGIHHCTMMGYRIRIEDASKVLSSIFG